MLPANTLLDLCLEAFRGCWVLAAPGSYDLEQSNCPTAIHEPSLAVVVLIVRSGCCHANALALPCMVAAISVACSSVMSTAPAPAEHQLYHPCTVHKWEGLATAQDVAVAVVLPAWTEHGCFFE